MESLFLTRDQALSLWSGSIDSKTLDYQRTHSAAAAAKSLQSCLTLCDPIDGSRSIKYWELTLRKSLEYKTQHHPTTSSTLSRTTKHLNNKQQQQNTNQIINRQGYHLTQPCPSEEKQTNKQSSAQISPYMKFTQITGPTLAGQKPKGRNNSTLKPGKRRPQTQ